MWWYHDGQTGKQASLKTRIESEALRLLDIMNQPSQAAGYHLQMARTHLQYGDAEGLRRTWHDVFAAVIACKTGKTKFRWERAEKDKAIQSILEKVVVETNAETLLKVLHNGTVSTNVFLRRLHNFALDMNWLLSALIPKKAWPKVEYGEKRAITPDEHECIITREKNSERRAFYELCWHVGGSQTDMAELKADNLDWQTRTLTYFRNKTGTKAQMEIGTELEKLLRTLPTSGHLFPYLATVREADRATEFRQRCKGLNISGITLHSYRYAWAERAKSAGYPERFAQQALGHSSKAIHRAYARNADVKLPSLEEYEQRMRGRLVTLQTGAANN